MTCSPLSPLLDASTSEAPSMQREACYSPRSMEIERVIELARRDLSGSSEPYAILQTLAEKVLVALGENELPISCELLEKIKSLAEQHLPSIIKESDPVERSSTLPLALLQAYVQQGDIESSLSWIEEAKNFYSDAQTLQGPFIKECWQTYLRALLEYDFATVLGYYETLDTPFPTDYLIEVFPKFAEIFWSAEKPNAESFLQIAAELDKVIIPVSDEESAYNH